MSRNLIANPSFEASGLSPWVINGPVTQETSAVAFEGSQVAQLGPVVLSGDMAIISQLFLVPSTGSHLHVSWSMLGLTAITGQLTIEMQFFGSTNDGLPPLRFDTIFVKAQSALVSTDGWQTAVVATTAKPSGTVWARIRFILQGSGVALGAAQIDNVVVTAESS